MQDEYSDHWGFTWHRLIKKSFGCTNTIGAVITERKILTLFCLFIQTSPIDFAVASGNGNRLLAGKLQLQITNKLRSPQCQCKVKLHYCILPDAPDFSLPCTFNILKLTHDFNSEKCLNESICFNTIYIHPAPFLLFLYF